MEVSERISNNSKKTSDEIVFDTIAYNDPSVICEKFNEYFIESIAEINNSIPGVTQQNVQNIERAADPEHLFKFKQTNIEEVTEIMHFLTKKVNKSDICNSMVWFDSIEYCGYFLMNIINESLTSGYFPGAWKKATVVPIPKIMNTKRADEHRGINMLPVDEKIIEIVVKKQLVKHIEINKLLSPCQSAFRANHSCESAIKFIINEWKMSIENGQV